jgi:hypothetical protein
MEGTQKCRHCGEVIGAYEPMIVLTEGKARRTSRAAERAVGAPMPDCYHDACYTQAHGEDLTLQ